MTPKEKWEQRGRNDYPRSDLYPRRDKYGPRCERWYLNGWHKRARIEEIDRHLEMEE
jgi:hypothetical protein